MSPQCTQTSCCRIAFNLLTVDHRSFPVCAVCDFNRPGKTCDRRLTWAWRGEFFPARRDEYNMIRHALNQETFPPKRPGGPSRRFADLAPAEQTALTHKRLGD